MTENETIKLLRSMQNPKQDYANVVCAPAFCTGFRFVYPEPEDYAIEEAIKAIKEIQQYREIGTVEECREAVEKRKPKRPIKDKWKHDCCPSCGWFVSEETGWGDRYNPHCENCGQAIQWDENLEGTEDE